MAIGNESIGAFAIGGWGQFIRAPATAEEGRARGHQNRGKRCPEIRPLGRLMDFMATRRMMAIFTEPVVAWAKHAAKRADTLEQIKNELINGHDFKQNVSRRRQLE